MALVQAKGPFSVGYFVVHAGDVFDSSDPVVKGREDLFDEIEVRSFPVMGRRQTAAASGVAVETASANPGAARKLSKPLTKPEESSS